MRSPPPRAELLPLSLGPPGNLRAPTLRKGRALIVGFDEATYKRLLGCPAGWAADRRAISAAGFAERALEAGQRAHHRVALDRERDADVAGHAEARPRHGQHAFLGEQTHERHVVGDRRAREHVEGALRLHALVADAGDALVHG